MRSPQNNLRWRISVGVGLAVLSLCAAAPASGQMLTTTAPQPGKKIEGGATWYPVPKKSLAKRRAAANELTAASNRLPLTTRVRVTHLANGKEVVVRITDRGIYRRGTIIDLCKEAAEKLDMLREGSARVRLEILPEDKIPTSKAVAPW